MPENSRSRTRSRRARMLLGLVVVVTLCGMAVLTRLYLRGTVLSDSRVSAEGLGQTVETRLVQRDADVWFQMSAVFDSDIDAVWSLITDREAMQRSSSGLKQIEILDDGVGEGGPLRLRMSFDLPIGSRETLIRIHNRVEPDERVEEWEQYEGDFITNKGRWTLQRLDDSKTFVRFEVLCDPGVALPRWLVLSVMRDFLPPFFRSLRGRLQATEGVSR